MSRRRWARLLMLLPLAHLALGMELAFEPNGDARLGNELVALRVTAKPGAEQGITSWVFRPTGAEQVDVLYGQTDYVKGRLMAERWDPVEQAGLPTTANPDLGRYYIRQSSGLTADGSGLVLVQQATGDYRLTRTLILRRDLALVEVQYRLTNLTAPRRGLGLRLISSASPGARGPYQRRDDDIFMPLAAGPLALDQALNGERFQAKYGADVFVQADWAGQPRRKWQRADRVNATLTGNWAVQANRTHGDGLAILVDSQALQGYYTAVGATLESCLDPVILAPGEQWDFSVQVGSFSGLAGAPVVAASPLFIQTVALAVKDGQLQGTVVPLFQGTLRVMAGERELAKWPATPTAPLVVAAAGVGDAWHVEARDRQGVLIGQFSAQGVTTLRPVTVPATPVARPTVPANGVVTVGDLAGLPRELTGYTVVCPWAASDAEKSAARALARRLGLGLAWENVGGPQLVLGSAANQYVADLGQVHDLLSPTWPGPGRGVLAVLPNTELTEAPMILLAGSDPAGTLAVLAQFQDRWVTPQPAAPGGFRLWPSRPDRKLFPYSRPVPALDGRVGQATDAPIVLQAARGEYEPAQVGLTAFDDLRDVQLTVSPLVHAVTGEALSTKQSLTSYRKRLEPLGLRWVEYFPLDRQDGWAGYPDPLLWQPERSIPAGETRALWVTAFIPEKAPPGRYRGQVTASAGGASQSVAIEVEVCDFAVPLDGLAGEPYMALDRFPKITSSQVTERGIQPLIANLVEHGMRVIHLGPPQSLRWHFSTKGEFKGKEMPWLLVSEDGAVAMDVSHLAEIVEWCDKAAAPFKLQYMVYAKTVLDDLGAFKKVLPKRFADQPEREGHLDQSHYAEEMLGLYQRWLKQRGWEARFVLKLTDEPEGFLYWRERFTLAARRLGLRHMTAFNALDWAEAEPHLGEVALWQPLYMLYDAPSMAKARALGAQISWYNCGPPPRITNAASASELRGYLWQAAKADLDIVAWWGIQCWGYYEGDGALWRDRYAHWNSVIYPTHPTRQPINHEGKIWRDVPPLDSIRWEHIRDGMEDAWYVNELRRRLAAATLPAQAAAVTQAQATIDAIWQEVFPTLNHYRPPYEQMMASRAKLAAAILSLPPTKAK